MARVRKADLDQLAAPAFRESLLLDAAHALEGEIGFDGRPR